MQVDAVIFDFDGVLGCTMDDNYLAWASACSEFDLHLKQEEYFLLEGLSVKEVARTLLNRYKKNINYTDRLAKSKEKHYLDHNQFSLYLGSEKLLGDLKSSVMLGLVTGAGRKRLNATLTEDFFAHFAYIVSGDQNIPPKPDPAPYLAAVSGLKVKSSNVIVVENAPLGIRSAKEAGLFCLAISSTLDKSFLSEADVVVENINEAGKWLMSEVKVLNTQLSSTI